MTGPDFILTRDPSQRHAFLEHTRGPVPVGIRRRLKGTHQASFDGQNQRWVMLATQAAALGEYLSGLGYAVEYREGSEHPAASGPPTFGPDWECPDCRIRWHKANPPRYRCIDCGSPGPPVPPPSDTPGQHWTCDTCGHTCPAVGLFCYAPGCSGRLIPPPDLIDVHALADECRAALPTRASNGF
jgi:DNA-directed RNA polymerase subunit RPC12/RpoP